MRGQLSLLFMTIPPTIEVASLGFENSLILMVLALVVFGPRRLPEIGRQIGKIMYEIRKASNDFKFQMEEELRKAEDEDRRKKEEERLRALALAAPAQSTEAVPASTTVPAESPYPGEGVYPPAIAATPQSSVNEPYPRIQPPSTGEPVPAARPASLTAQAEPATAPADATTPAPEQAPHG
jgi:sec-independent protein translocase protein TatB